MVAAIGLILAGLGLYSVVSYVSLQHRREFGIRRALAVGSPELIWTAVKSTMAAVVVGATAGALLSASVDHLATELTQLKTRDPLILGAVIAVLLAVGSLASLIPARRAAQVDPLVALRE